MKLVSSAVGWVKNVGRIILDVPTKTYEVKELIMETTSMDTCMINKNQINGNYIINALAPCL